MSQASPSPTRRVTTEPFRGSVTVTFGEATIASSNRALLLREGTYAPVFYIPFEDINFELLSRTETATRCPYKGVASYWSVSASGEAAKDAMWAYETPIQSVAEIAGHGAFDRRFARIDAITETGERFSG
jgi:uncharacterized protein (DUF427 family)